MPPTAVVVPLTIGRCPTRPRHMPMARCFHCDRPLERHQPDPDSPGRMIGICRECGRWYLLDLVEEAGEVVIVHLPGPPFFAEALGG